LPRHFWRNKRCQMPHQPYSWCEGGREVPQPRWSRFILEEEKRGMVRPKLSPSGDRVPLWSGRAKFTHQTKRHFLPTQWQMKASFENMVNLSAANWEGLP
jgi:hypothetical protein